MTGSARRVSVLAVVHATVDGDQDALLTALLEAVHAALYGYGVLGARLPRSQQDLARAAGDALRADRDTLANLLRDAGQVVPGPLPAYDLAVSDPTIARRLATGLEEGLALRWGDLVGATDDAGLRTTATQALRRSAIRAARWRAIRGLVPSVPFPGRG